MNVRRIMTFAFICAIVGLAIGLSGCERMQTMMPDAETETPPKMGEGTTIKVGLLQPPGYYPSFTRGAELALDEINMGLDSRQVELVYRDEIGDTLADTITELVDVEKVVGIIGPVFSSNAVTIDPSVHVPMLAGATDANRVTQTNDFIFLVGGSNVVHGQLMAKFAVETLTAKTAAIIWQNEDVYSKGLVDAFDAKFRALGGTIAGVQTYESGDLDFTTQLTAIKAAAPDVLLLASFAPEVPRIMKAAREMDIEATFIGGDGMDDPENMFGTLTKDGGNNEPLEGTYYTTNLDLTSTDPATQHFISTYKMKFEEEPDGVAASGYDNVRLLMMAIKNTESTDPVVVRDAIAATKNYTGATFISSFDAQRRAVKGVGIIKIENEQIMPQTFVPGETAPNTSE